MIFVSLPAIVVAAVVLLFISGMTPPEWTAGATQRLRYIQTQPWIVMHYLRLFFLPIGLSADTDLPLIMKWYDTRVLFAVLAIAALLGSAVRLRRERSTRPIAFGLFWFFLTLLPTSLFPLAEVANEHRIFLPYIGLTLAVTCGADFLMQRLGRRYRVDLAAAALVLTVLGGNALGTIQRNKTWRTEESLWLDVTEKSPGNGRAMMNYGLTQLAKGDFRRARDYFERAATLTPNYSTLEINRGIVASALRDEQEAERHFKRALELSADVDSHFFYARWLAEKGRAAESIPHLQQAIALSPAARNPRRLLMTIYFAAGERDRLQRLAADILAIDPGDKTAAHDAASAPDSTRGYDSLFQDGLAAARQGRHLEAAVAYRECLALSRSADAWNNLGWELAALGLRSQAVEAYQAALQIDPGYERARNNLRQLSHQ